MILTAVLRYTSVSAALSRLKWIEVEVVGRVLRRGPSARGAAQRGIFRKVKRHASHEIRQVGATEQHSSGAPRGVSWLASRAFAVRLGSVELCAAAAPLVMTGAVARIVAVVARGCGGCR